MTQPGTGGSGGDGDSAGTPPSQPGAVARALRRHGLRTAPAIAIEQIGEDLRQRMLQQGREFAAMADATTGARASLVISGAADEIDISIQVNTLLPGRHYVHLHTHPNSAAFSDTDARVLVGVTGLRTLALIGGDGTWYFLSKQRGVPLATPSAITAAFDAEVVALRPTFEALTRPGAMTADAAWREVTHRIWQAIAPQLGLRYDRIEP